MTRDRQLYDNIETEFSIRCDKCNSYGKVLTVAWKKQAFKHFKSQGWEYRKGNVLCPKCSNNESL